MKADEKSFSKNEIINYLEYLKEYGCDISNQNNIYRKRFKDINKEIDLFLKLLKRNNIHDQSFLNSIIALKFHCNPIRDFFIDYIYYQRGKLTSTQHFKSSDDVEAGAKAQNQKLRDEINIFLAKLDTILNKIQTNNK